MNTRSRRRPGAARRPDQEGAAMIIVMLILLSTTSLAVFAVHSTSYEVRASGFARQAMQSEYVSEAGLTTTLSIVDSVGPRAILFAVAQQQASGVAKPVMAPFEPELDDHTEGYRIYSTDLSALTSSGTEPVTVDALGARQPYTPTFTVDVYDQFQSSRPVAGYPADGGGLSFFHATYTSRGRMRLTAGDTTVSGPDTREYHETASSSRAYGVSGPFAR